jgi:hypothetical protein
MKEILDEAFALVGKDIVLAHAKDLDHDGEAGHKAAGRGVLEYDRYLALLRKYDFKGPLLLHGLSVIERRTGTGLLVFPTREAGLVTPYSSLTGGSQLLGARARWASPQLWENDGKGQ